MDFLYALFDDYGLWVLLVVIFLSQLGVPLGSMFFLMWFGSTIESNEFLLIAIASTSCAAVLGDISAYYLGKRFSPQLYRAEKRYKWLADKLNQSRKLIESYGKWIIFFTRFLVTGLGPIVNYLLGTRKYPIHQFIASISAGELLFTAELLYFGYYFKDTWEDLLAVISDVGWLLFLIIISIWLGKKLLSSKQSMS